MDPLRCLRRRSSESTVGSAGSTDASAGLPIFDPAGTAFEAMRGSGVNVGMYRVQSVQEIDAVGPDVLVLFAAYDAAQLERGGGFMARHSTVVVGVGLGEHAGSRALSLGALGYLHDGLSAAGIRERFSDAVARHSYRRIRAMRPLLSA